MIGLTDGFGIIGGLLIIEGGGALITLLKNADITGTSIVDLIADDRYVESECCKLITFSREILVGKYSDYTKVFEIYRKVLLRISEVQNQMDDFMRLVDNEKDREKKKDMKLKVKVAKKSLKYLQRTANELMKTIKPYESDIQKGQLILSDKENAL